MKNRTWRALLVSLLLGGCAAQSHTIPVASGSNAYNGTASVGDFLTIRVDSTAHTIAYTNHTNGDAGTVPYTVGADGGYAIDDPTGNLVAAYEIPGYALVMEATKTGPSHAVSSLISAVESGPISPSTFAGHSYNYMQFRTNSGGFEAGSFTMDASGNGTGTSYWPFGAMNGSSQFLNLSGISTAGATTDPSGTFMSVSGPGGDAASVFGTANGQFLVDTPNGAILGLAQASSSAFSSSFAGTYHAMFYEKTSASTGMGNVESGTPGFINAVVTIDASGALTIVDSHGTTLAAGTLSPVASTSYLTGSGGLGASPGLFTLRVATAGSQQDVFMAFQGRSLMLASFTAPLPLASSNTYDYFYGVGLH